MPSIEVAVFDAYGTVLDLHSAVESRAGRIGPDWQRFNADWRSKQLEYCWARSLAGPAEHLDFAAVTEAALRMAAHEHGITDPTLLRDLLDGYGELAAYPDAAPALRALQARGVGRAILSNGTPAMLARNIASAGLTGLLDDVLSVESVGVYKPDPRVYRLAADRFRVAPCRVAFFSSNPWDAFGAACAGLSVFWVNRRNRPVEYGLDTRATVIPGLSEIAALLA